MQGTENGWSVVVMVMVLKSAVAAIPSLDFQQIALLRAGGIFLISR